MAFVNPSLDMCRQNRSNITTPESHKKRRQAHSVETNLDHIWNLKKEPMGGEREQCKSGRDGWKMRFRLQNGALT